MPNPHYHSYMLRLWRDHTNHPWRASLQCTETGDKAAFTDVSALFAYLVALLASDMESAEFERLAAWLRTHTENK